MAKQVVGTVLLSVALALSLLAQTPDPLTVGATATITPEQLHQTGEFDAGPALELYRPDVFNTVDGSLLIHSLPALTLLDGRRFPISGDLARMGIVPADLFPIAFLQSVQVQKISASPQYGSDATGGVVDLRLKRYSSGGEMGVFYGHASGRHGGDDFSAYIVGGVGNDKVQITAGAAYEESTYRSPRLRP